MKIKVSRLWAVFTLLVMGALVIAACTGSTPDTQSSEGEDSSEVVQESVTEDEHMEGEDDHAEDEHMEGEDEHMEGDEHEHVDPPHDYEGLENPLHDDPEAITAGAELFEVNCATCHGETGLGDGPAAVALDPKPAPLADAEMMSDMSDAYIFWRITEGGAMEPFNSAMPPWGEVFTDQQRWQLVSFVRTLGD